MASERTWASRLLTLVPTQLSAGAAKGWKGLDAMVSLNSQVAASAEVFRLSWWMTLKLSNPDSLHFGECMFRRFGRKNCASSIAGVQMDYKVTGRKKCEEYGKEVKTVDNQDYRMKAGQNLF